MTKLLIGVHGRRESGKDTVAAMLVEHLVRKGEDAVVDRFASTIYKMAAQVDPVFRPNMTHLEKGSYVLNRQELGTRRNFLELLGTEFGRDMIHSSLWTSILMERIARSSTTVIVADVRVKDEQAAILANNGCILHLVPDWPASEALGTHHFTQSALQIVDPHREVVLDLEYGKLAETSALVASSVDSWCAKGLGLYMGEAG